MSINITDLPNLAQWRDSPRKRGGSKYNNKVTMVGDRRFDSKAEARRWCDLLLLERSGAISAVRCQVPFELVPATTRPSGGAERPVTYIADFVYTDSRTGQQVVEDVKGASPDVWVLKRKLMLWRHGIEVIEVRA